MATPYSDDLLSGYDSTNPLSATMSIPMLSGTCFSSSFHGPGLRQGFFLDVRVEIEVLRNRRGLNVAVLRLGRFFMIEDRIGNFLNFAVAVKNVE